METPALTRVEAAEGAVRRGAIVAVDQLDLIGLAAKRDFRGQAIGILHAEDLLLAAGRGVAGRWLEHADLHDLITGSSLLLCGAAGAQRQRHAQYQNKRDDLFHFISSHLKHIPQCADTCFCAVIIYDDHKKSNS